MRRTILMGVLTEMGKTWDERQEDIERISRDLLLREAFVALPADTVRLLAKVSEDLNFTAPALERFLIQMGAMYLYTLDEKTLNVIRALMGANVNVQGPAYELPF